MLADGDCVAAIGPLPVSGRVVVTTQRVCFTPTALRRVLGAPPWSLEHRDIQKLSFDVPARALVLEAGPHSQRLIGLGASVVYEALAPWLPPWLAGEGPPPYAACERVLLFADAAIELNELLSAPCEVIVTTRRLRVRLRRLERFLWPELEVDTPLDAITGFAITGNRRRLELQWGGKTARFLGSALPALYGALQAAAELASGEVAPERLDLQVWPAFLYRDLVAHPGALVRTATRLTYLATGTLDALAGVPAVIELTREAILGISLQGLFDRRIEVVTGRTRVRFACADSRSRFESLVAWMADHAPGPVWLGGTLPEADRREIARILRPWREQTPLPTTPRLFSPAVRVSERAVASSGWLVVGLEYLTWLPGAGPASGAAPFRLLLHGQTVLPIEAPPHEIHLQATAGGLYRWRFAAPGSGPNDEAACATAEIAPFFLNALPDVEALSERPERRKRRARIGAVRSGEESGADRRETFRAGAVLGEVPPLVFWLVVKDLVVPLECELIDLSLGGCCIRGPYRLPADAVVRVDLPVGDETYPLEADVVHEHELVDGTGWIHGLHFGGRWETVEYATRDAWMSLQQSAARRMLSPTKPLTR